MSVRRAVIAFAVVAVAGLGALVIAAAGDRRPVAFTLNENGLESLTAFHQGQRACQGPINVPVPYAGVFAFIGTARAPGTLLTTTVTDDATGATLASGHVFARNEPGVAAPRYAIGFNRTVPANRTMTICFTSEGPALAALVGGLDVDSSITLTVAGRRTEQEAAMLFLRPHPPTLLSDLPTLFTRAALFRPGWVGEWTYWVLLIAVLAGFWFAAMALARAAREDRAAEGGVAP